jgi:dipeptidyl aminopeptidase/acylaminoacyl peptidase
VAPRLKLAIAAIASVVCVVALAGQTRPEPAPSPRASVSASEPVPAEGAALSPPVKVDFVSRGNRLTGFLFPPRRSRSGARAPVIVYNHGSEQDPDLVWLGDVGRFYQAHGFAVFFPWRQGCSGSGGTFWRERFPLVGDENDTPLREERNIRALKDELVDVLAAVDYARGLPSVDPERVYVGGASFGGLLAVMAAGAVPNLKGAIACSGAAWTFMGNTPLGQRALDEFARAAKAPVFLMQAKNDYNQGTSETLGETMTRAGVPHAVQIYPPFGTTQTEGHAAFCNRGSAAWGDDVLAFLKAD